MTEQRCGLVDIDTDLPCVQKPKGHKGWHMNKNGDTWHTDDDVPGDPRDKPLERICYTPSGKVAHLFLGPTMSTSAYCGAIGFTVPTTDAGWAHVNKLPTCRRCEEILRPVPKNFKHTVTAEVTEDNVIILHNGGKLPVLAQQAIMAEALWACDPSGICSIEAFPYDKGEGWAKFRFRKVKDL